MKTFFTTWIVALMFAASLAATLAGDVTKNAMRQKLTFAQGILEGLALEKYDLIITNAVQLRDLSQTNSFFLLGNPDYRQRSTNFFQNVDELVKAAREKQLPNATAAYSRLTESCVECHKSFRREQVVKAMEANSKK
jgi:hypothetical protein